MIEELVSLRGTKVKINWSGGCEDGWKNINKLHEKNSEL